LDLFEHIGWIRFSGHGALPVSIPTKPVTSPTEPVSVLIKSKECAQARYADQVRQSLNLILFFSELQNKK
jgi:hypothetical protein